MVTISKSFSQYAYLNKLFNYFKFNGYGNEGDKNKGTVIADILMGIRDYIVIFCELNKCILKYYPLFVHHIC